MSKRFVCRFAVGRNNLAYSGIWRVWTAKNTPDLYLAAQSISGELKATVHCPRPPHVGWERHLSFTKEASGPVAVAAKEDGGRHKVRWPGCAIGPSCTLEYRVIFFGKSLEKNGTVVPADVALLPIPTEQESVEVAVLLGPAEPIPCPRYKNVPTHLLSEGCLSDGRRVWVVYYTTQIETNTPPQQQAVVPTKHYVDPSVDLSKVPMRGAVFSTEDGHLVFWDKRATATKA